MLGASKQVRSVASATEPHAWLSARTRVVESRQEGRTVVTIGIDTHKATLAVHYVFGVDAAAVSYTHLTLPTNREV